jgi:hypothetical protein
MADNSGSSAILGVIVGAILVIGIAVYAFGGFGALTGRGDTNIRVSAPAAPAAPAPGSN